MKYITFPTEKINEVSQEVLDELHLSPRKSVDGTEVIMKVANYEKLFPSVQTLPAPEEGEEPQEVTYPYPTYEGDALNSLLESSKWTEVENPVLDIPSVLSDTPVLSDTRTTQTKSKKSTKTTVL